MTVVVSMLLFAFGLDTATGKLNYNKINSTSYNNVTTDSLGNIIIYDPEYNPRSNPVYYQSPNIIVPNPTANDINKNIQIIPNSTSSPAYQS